MTLRILVATDQWHPDARGGSARLAADSSRALAGLGHEVTVLAPTAPGKERLEETDGLTLVHALPRGRLPQTLTDATATARAARRLGPADVLLAHHATVGAGLAAARPGTPLVLAYHASPALEQRFVGSARASLLAPLLAAWERRAVERADRILLLSRFSRALLASRHPAAAARSALVPAVVDTERFRPEPGARERLGLGADEPVVFAARRLEPRTGVDLLLDAAAVLSGVRVVVAGTGSLNRTLAGRGELLGHVPEDELRDWYRAADLAVMPSRALEGFGLATVEALACGTPVVGTPVGATPEILAPLDRRLVAEAAEPRALAAAIRRGLALAPELRDRCRPYAVERFGAERAARAWEDVLRQALTR